MLASATGTPTRMSLWCQPFRRGVVAIPPGRPAWRGRGRRPRRGGSRPVPGRTGAAAWPGHRRRVAAECAGRWSHPRSRRRSETGYPVSQRNPTLSAHRAPARRPRRRPSGRPPPAPYRRARRRVARCAGSAHAAASRSPRRTPTWCGWRRRSARAGCRSRWPNRGWGAAPRPNRRIVSRWPRQRAGLPNLNIRWATRRIWISSAPSVIR